MKLSELSTIAPGFSPLPAERRKKGKYLLLGGRNIHNGKLRLTPQDSYVNEIDRDSFRRAIAKPGDIIVSTLFDTRKLYTYKPSDPKAVVNNSCAIIRAPNDNDYILSYLRTLKGERDFLHEATRGTSGSVIRRISIQQLGEIEIPILPVEQLKKLSDAYIGGATSGELESLRSELTQGIPGPLFQLDERPQSSVAELSASYSASVHLPSQDELREKLAAKDAEILFLKNRLEAIESQLTRNKLEAKIHHGETSNLEFKSTLRRNLRTRTNDIKMENAVLKTVVAFCNTDGGELLIGISDDKAIIGIEADEFPNSDKFLLHLRNLLKDRITPSVLLYVDFGIERVKDKEICIIKCKKCRGAIWLKSEGEHFYVRSGPSSTELSPSEALNYMMSKFTPQSNPSGTELAH